MKVFLAVFGIALLGSGCGGGSPVASPSRSTTSIAAESSTAPRSPRDQFEPEKPTCKDETGDAVHDGLAVGEKRFDLLEAQVAPHGRTIDARWRLGGAYGGSGARLDLVLNVEHDHYSHSPRWGFITTRNHAGEWMTSISIEGIANYFSLVKTPVTVEGNVVEVTYDLPRFEGSERVTPLSQPLLFTASTGMLGDDGEDLIDSCGPTPLQGLAAPTAVSTTIPSDRPGQPRSKDNGREVADALLEAWQLNDPKAAAGSVVRNLREDPFRMFSGLRPDPTWRIGDCQGAVDGGDTSGLWACEVVTQDGTQALVFVGEHGNDGFVVGAVRRPTAAPDDPAAGEDEVGD